MIQTMGPAAGARSQLVHWKGEGEDEAGRKPGRAGRFPAAGTKTPWRSLPGGAHANHTQKSGNETRTRELSAC